MHGCIGSAELVVPPDSEVLLLERVVDAMLDAQSQLQDADGQQWAEILLESCRRQKRAHAGGLCCAPSPC